MQRRDLLTGVGVAITAGSLAWRNGALAATTPRFAYVGTYTHKAPGGSSGGPAAEGIYILEVEAETGALNVRGHVPSANPSFLALHPNGRVLYAINEIDDYEGGKLGSAEAYAIDPTSGGLELLNRQALSGHIPAHLAVDPSGSHLIVALYMGAAYDVLPIEADGRLGKVSSSLEQKGSGPNARRQEAPHPHAVTFDPAGRFIATADLGIDKVEVLELRDGELARLSEKQAKPGAGPRHVAFDPSGRRLYVINELDATIVGYEYDASNGTLGAEVARIGTVPDDFPGQKSTAEILVHPGGRFLYGSNRKFADHPLADSIAVFSIAPDTGALELVEHTTQNIAFPRAFQIDPSGRWLYAMNQKGDSIVQLEIDQTTGALRPTGRITEVPTPVSLVFL